MGDEQKESPQEPQRSLAEMFKRLQEYLKQHPEALRGITDFRVTQEGAVDSTQIVSVMKNLPSLQLDDVEQGDAVWWTNQANTSTYYFLVRTITPNEYSENPDISGALRNLDQNGVIKREYEDVILNGANMGSILYPSTIVKGAGVSLTIPPRRSIKEIDSEEKEREIRNAGLTNEYLLKEIRTGPVANMGIIRRQMLDTIK